MSRIASCNWETIAVETALCVALDIYIILSRKKMVTTRNGNTTQQQLFSGAIVHLQDIQCIH